MSGRWRIDPDDAGQARPPGSRDRAATVLALNDARRFGSVDLIDDADARRLAARSPRSGPEPLGPGSHRRPPEAGLRRPQAGGQAAAARPADRRRARQHLCLRSAVARADRPAQAGGQSVARGACALGAGDSRGARTTRSATAARPCATMPGPTASSATSPRRFAVYGREGEAVPARRRRHDPAALLKADAAPGLPALPALSAGP